MSAKLSKELRAKQNIRSVRVRTGDKVKILRGQFKGKTGVVEKSIKPLACDGEGIELSAGIGGPHKGNPEENLMRVL